MNKQALIIGYGNPLRGDDRVGWAIAERLAVSVADHRATIRAVHQLSPELAEQIHDADLVIFVDASSEGKPGTWRCDLVEPESTRTPSFGHHFDIAGLLAYAQALYQSCPIALVVSVTAESFACQDNLSPKVEAVLPTVVQYIREQIIALNPNQEPAHA